ncbi:hypothetical protein [Janthinobacterium sp. P210006]|uniref:hypothetical protein n=1 Tax=Janthinobacterium sp. P210006 TaxID=3112939 RepID=UPI002E26EAC9|nr:hypothetical protein [Janthinobacterium sp. P210006]
MIIKLVALLLPLMIFNTISFGAVPLPFVTLLLALTCAIMMWKRKIIPGFSYTAPLLSLLVISFCKAIFFLGTDSIVDVVKISTMLIALAGIYFIFKENLQDFLQWYFYAMILILLYMVYQFVVLAAGLDRSAWGVNLPVEMWNANAWHVSIIRDGIIRVQGFAYEPAYLAIFLGFALFCANSFPGYRKWTIFIVVGLFATGSRNTMVFLVVFYGLLFSYKKLSENLIGFIYLLSFFFPVATFFLLDLNDGFDVSILARALPYKVIAENIFSDFWSSLIGVASYVDAIDNSAYLYGFSDVVISEKVNEDPKSFIAYLILHFGFLGFFVFIFSQWWFLRRSKISLIYMTSFNLLCFNINVLFWPIYWCVYALSIVIQKKITVATEDISSKNDVTDAEHGTSIGLLKK